MTDCETISPSTKFIGIAFISLFKDQSPTQLDPLRQQSVLPIPILELGYGVLAKALVTWLLEWKAQREASGFTEQRRLPALGSGRITGRTPLADL
ncbi:hypothetical protein V6N13_083887 [Hibiscus sabdariffa]|uniref:Uncharacterized protein n=1 Tax=Hibiscus sabdariffa TaxID=183260 RepID=A0ABR2SZP6_9ROSI